MHLLVFTHEFQMKTPLVVLATRHQRSQRNQGEVKGREIEILYLVRWWWWQWHVRCPGVTGGAVRCHGWWQWWHVWPVTPRAPHVPPPTPHVPPLPPHVPPPTPHVPPLPPPVTPRAPHVPPLPPPVTPDGTTRDTGAPHVPLPALDTQLMHGIQNDMFFSLSGTVDLKDTYATLSMKDTVGSLPTAVVGQGLCLGCQHEQHVQLSEAVVTLSAKSPFHCPQARHSTLLHMVLDAERNSILHINSPTQLH